MEETDICVKEVGGSSIVQYKPLFSHDGKYLICPCGNLIKVFSTATGECFQRLVGHENTVTGVCHHPRIRLQILSSSLDSTVKVWDYEDATLLSTVKFPQALLGIYTNSCYSNVAFITVQSESKITNAFCRFKLQTTKIEQDAEECRLIADEISSNYNKLIRLSKTFIVVAYDHYFLVFSDPEHHEGKQIIRHEIQDCNFPISCIACHPTDDICATGHENGEIRIWYSITNLDKVIYHVQHWHSLQVLSLSFSPNGSTLLSGGHEAVLVHWREGGKDFLPRLGSPISDITVSDDNSLYATSHFDNSILIITNYFTIKEVIEGFTAASEPLSCGLHYDEATGACVTNGKPGHLLFYFPSTDVQLYNLDIVSRNFISSAELTKPLSKTIITCVSFVRTEQKENFMATVEFDQKCKRDQKLKFWQFDNTEKSWSLETVVTSPHNNCDVTSIEFHPLEALCATTSVDGVVKIWLRDENDSGWFCDSTASYRGYTSVHCSFSDDGSVLALVFGHTVCLCEPLSVDNLTLLSSFSLRVKSATFGRGKCCHLLVILTNDQVQCWNVISASMMWYYEVKNIDFLVRDNFSENMAVFTQTNEVYIFHPSKKVPLCRHKLNIEAVAACFVPSQHGSIEWLKNSELYIVSGNSTVHKFCLKSEVEISTSRPRPSAHGRVDTPMAALLSAQRGTPTEDQFSKEPLRHRTIEEAMQYIMDTPVHVLPPMTSLCNQFISSLLFDTTSSEQAKSNLGNTENDVQEALDADDDVTEQATTNNDVMKDVSQMQENTKYQRLDLDWLVPVFEKKFAAKHKLSTK